MTERQPVDDPGPTDSGTSGLILRMKRTTQVSVARESERSVDFLATSLTRVLRFIHKNPPACVQICEQRHPHLMAAGSHSHWPELLRGQAG